VEIVVKNSKSTLLVAGQRFSETYSNRLWDVDGFGAPKSLTCRRICTDNLFATGDITLIAGKE
jgi:hypothetical protein